RMCAAEPLNWPCGARGWPASRMGRHLFFFVSTWVADDGFFFLFFSLAQGGGRRGCCTRSPW
uniref:Uncharacterized protein n=1 Tax=Aegilops tauschii subsp. strangulata TaxID=200361 RepID=A0A453PNW9_AEGTS